MRNLFLILMRLPSLYVISCFSLSAYKIFSLSFESLFIINLSLGVFKFILIGVCWHICKCYFFKYSASFSLLLLGLPLFICWSTWWCPRGLLGSIPLSFSLFSVCSSYLMISLVLSSSLILLPAQKCLVIVIVKFQFTYCCLSYRFSFWFLPRFSLLLLLFASCPYMVFLTFSVFSFSFLAYLKTDV